IFAASRTCIAYRGAGDAKDPPDETSGRILLSAENARAKIEAETERGKSQNQARQTKGKADGEIGWLARGGTNKILHNCVHGNFVVGLEQRKTWRAQGFGLCRRRLKTVSSEPATDLPKNTPPGSKYR